MSKTVYNVPGFVFLQISLKFYWETWIRLQHQNLWWTHPVLYSPCRLNPSRLNFPENEIQLSNKCRHWSMSCLFRCKSFENFFKSLYHETQIKIRRYIDKHMYRLIPSIINVETKNGNGVRIMVLNETFNNISVLLWWSVLLVEETGVCGGNHRPATSHWHTYHIKLYWVHLTISKIQTHNWWYADCTCSCKSNYHTIMTTTALTILWKSS